MFKFKLSQEVKIRISGEAGHVKGRCDYINDGNRYFLHMKTADGRARDCWFDESEIGEADTFGGRLK